MQTSGGLTRVYFDSSVFVAVLMRDEEHHEVSSQAIDAAQQG